MTQNLRLVGSRTLTSADSNVTSNFTLTASDSGTWCTTNDSACDDQSMVLDSGNTTYGTYYNWYAATAGTGKYSTSSGNVSSSVCPKGWRLPTGGSSGEFQTLYSNYNSSELMRGGPAFVLSGDRNGSSTRNQGSRGFYWSSSALDSNLAYYLYLNSSIINSVDNYNKYFGFTVRCIAQ